MHNKEQSGFRPETHRIQSITNIICSVIRSRMILNEGCQLLSVPVVPDKCQESPVVSLYENSTVSDAMETRFLAAIHLPRAEQLLDTIGNGFSLVIDREADPATTALEPSSTSLFSLVMNQPELRNASSLLLARAPRPRRVTLQCGVDVAREHLSVIVAPTQRKLKVLGSDTRCFATAFTAYSTQRVTGVHRVWMNPVTDLVGFVDNSELPPGTTDVAESIVFALRDLFVSHDDGRRPDPFIDRDVVYRLVVAESSMPCVDKFNPGRVESLYRNGVKDSVYTLFKNADFHASFDRMKDKYGDSDSETAMLHMYFELPRFCSGGIAETFGGINIGATNENGDAISVNCELGGTAARCGYPSCAWTVHEYSDVVNYGFYFTDVPLLRAILSLSQALRFADDAAIQTIERQVKDLESTVMHIYRFMNATRSVCATELLLASV